MRLIAPRPAKAVKFIPDEFVIRLDNRLWQQNFPQSLVRYLQCHLRLYHPLGHGFATQVNAVLFKQRFLALQG
jgi:hypothetical protein